MPQGPHRARELVIACFGIPVLVADVGGTKETFSDESGVLVKTDQMAEEISGIILNCYENGRLQDLKNEAQSHFKKNFFVEKNVNELHEKMSQVYSI